MIHLALLIVATLVVGWMAFSVLLILLSLGPRFWLWLLAVAGALLMMLYGLGHTPAG